MLVLSSVVVLLVLVGKVSSVAGLSTCRTTELGHEYAGAVAETKSCITCQRWDRQSPHKHGMDAANFPDATLSDAQNYCRNPDMSPGGPWCYTMDPATRWQSCFTPFCKESSPCRTTELGREYAGTVDQTKSGITCQRWDHQSPHKHTFSVHAAPFPDETVGIAQNYCRNPDEDPGGPWCYTTDPDTRWQYCITPLCAAPPTTTTTPVSGILIKHEASGLCVGNSEGEFPILVTCDNGTIGQKWFWDGEHIMSKEHPTKGLYFDNYRTIGLVVQGSDEVGKVKMAPPTADDKFNWTYNDKKLVNHEASYYARLIPYKKRGVNSHGIYMGYDKRVSSEGAENDRIGGKDLFLLMDNDMRLLKWQLINV